MRKLLAVPLAVGALVVLLVAPANSATTVSVKDNFFSPKSATVGKGGTVTWMWGGRVAHNVTVTRSDPAPRRSPRARSRSSFNNKGTFAHRLHHPPPAWSARSPSSSRYLLTGIATLGAKLPSAWRTLMR